MSAFDPYHKWLGIRPEDQPPHHYRLLGISAFESDADVIDTAAEQRTIYLRTCATGAYVAHSQKLLNEVAAARLCLLNPQKKAAYDAELKAKLAPPPSANPPAAPAMAAKASAPFSSPTKVPAKTTAPAQSAPDPDPLDGFDVADELGAALSALPRAPSTGRARHGGADKGVVAGRSGAAGKKKSRGSGPPRGLLVGGGIGLLAVVGLVGGLFAVGGFGRGRTPSEKKSAEGGQTVVETPDGEQRKQPTDATRPPSGVDRPPSGTTGPSGTPGSDVSAGSWTMPLTPRGPQPPIAVAPFDAPQALAHQQAWSRYLARPMETTNSVGMRLRLIPPGRFTMGTPPNLGGKVEEQPVRTVTITKPLYFGVCEVTQEKYRTVMDRPAPGTDPGHLKRPALGMQRFGAVEFCEKLSQLPSEKAAGRVYRLPTEAEWEHACRAGTTTLYFFGDDAARLPDYEWFAGNSYNTIREVSGKRPNPWGLHDLCGNVGEWCADRFAANAYARLPAVDPLLDDPQVGRDFVVRGGNVFGGGNPERCRPAARGGLGPDWTSIGFRVVCEFGAPPVDLAAQPAATPARAVDLLAGLDVSAAWKHPATGWESDGRGLVVPLHDAMRDGKWGRIELPTAPPEEYGLEIDVTRLEGNDSFFVGLVLAGRQAIVVIDGWGSAASALMHVDGDHGKRIVKSGKRLATDRQSTIVCAVRRNRLQVRCDGAELFDWPGDLARLAAPEQTTPAKNRLFVGGQKSRFRITRLSLAPASPSTAPASAGPVPPPAVAPFDAAQAKAHQDAWAKHLGEPVETTNTVGMKFVVIPPGRFTMGDGQNAIAVELTRAFRFGRHEVTQGQYRDVIGAEPWKGRTDVREGADHAASHVSWTEAVAFCAALTVRERAAGKLSEDEEYRLPTEAEWEYACRAGTATAYSFGESSAALGDHAWYEANARQRGEAFAHAVGLKQPNPWGLFDVHGNVSEWCSDGWEGRPPGGRDPAGLPNGSTRVRRNGAWDGSAVAARSAYRSGAGPGLNLGTQGFRVVRTVAGTKGPTTATTVPRAASDPSDAPLPQWIWHGTTARDCVLRKEFPGGTRSALLRATADDAMSVSVDGRPVAESSDWKSPFPIDLQRYLAADRPVHVLQVVVRNSREDAGFVARLILTMPDGRRVEIVSDGTWESAESPDAKNWTPARVIAPLTGGRWNDDPTVRPFGERVTRLLLAPLPAPLGTP